MVNFLINLFTGILPDMIRLNESGQEVSASDILHLFGPFFTIAILRGLLHMILLVWFIVHLMQDKTTTSNDRLVWLLLLIFLNPSASVLLVLPDVQAGVDGELNRLLHVRGLVSSQSPAADQGARYLLPLSHFGPLYAASPPPDSSRFS